MLPGHWAQPRHQWPAAVEVLRIPDGGDQSARCDGADTGHLSEPGAQIATSMPCLDLCLELFDLLSEFLEMAEQPLDEHAEGAGQLVAGVLDEVQNPRGDAADALGNDETEFTEEATDLISLRRACLHESLAHPVQRQHRLLLNILDRHEAHGLVDRPPR